MSITEEQYLHTSFSRDEVCVLGLPFDLVTEKKTLEILDDAIEQRHLCFLSTPNLNFAIGSLADSGLRESVFQSDLSVADGMPLIWISKLIGAGLPERIAGSTLFELIRNRESVEKVKVFFFGGMGSVAELAAEELDKNSEGTKSVGSLNPGVGSVEEMSSEEVIQILNDSESDFLVVSLGAKKGQEWILRNHQRLNTGVVSHLGAVVNFVAGAVKRAPPLWQKIGLEWVWRIIEEPGLWKRYLYDGMAFMRIVFTRAIPLAVYGRLQLAKHKHLKLKHSYLEQGGSTKIILSGCVLQSNLSVLKNDLPRLVLDCDEMIVDIRELKYADSAFWALMLRLRTELSRRGKRLTVQGASTSLVWLSRLHMVGMVLGV